MKQLMGILILLGLIVGCSTNYPNLDPVGQPFPEVKGTSLEGLEIGVPQELKGKKSVLLLGFAHKTQFDIDRWLIGLDMREVQTNVYEMPTLNNFWANIFQNRIDESMRKGIPKELWKIVITVYEDGDIVQKFTGNEEPKNARVIVLDEAGVVQFFHDRGFSVGALKQLTETLSES